MEATRVNKYICLKLQPVSGVVRQTEGRVCELRAQVERNGEEGMKGANANGSFGQRV